MVRFIFLCIAVTILSFGIVPAYIGISGEHDALVANIEPAAGFDPGELENGTGLTFEEIYSLVDVYSDSSMAQEDIAFILNDIEPATGEVSEKINILEDHFSTGFDKQGHPAL